MPVARSYFIDKKKTLKAPHITYGGVTGAITLIAAGTGSAGHLYALRNPSTTVVVHVSRVRFGFNATTAFGAAQAMAFALFKLTGYSAAHAGATAITPAKRRTSHADASIATARIADTGALTAGTHTLATQPLARAGAHSTLPYFEYVYTPRDDHPLVLETNEGLLLRNEVLMGASGVGVGFIEVDGWER
jgi:hypothetical protein